MSEKRCHGLEERLNALETYNERLTGVVNALRKQNAPRRQAKARVEEATKKLCVEMAGYKQVTTKALDERERIVEQVAYIDMVAWCCLIFDAARVRWAPAVLLLSGIAMLSTILYDAIIVSI